MESTGGIPEKISKKGSGTLDVGLIMKPKVQRIVKKKKPLEQIGDTSRDQTDNE